MTRLLALTALLVGCTEPALVGRDLEGDTQQGGGPGEDIVWDATVDADGNVYAVGVFEEQITLGPDTHRAGPSGRGAFVASYDANGAYRWSRGWSASIFTYAGHVVVDGEAVYVLGYASGTLTTATGTIDPGDLQSLVLLFFDRAGNETAPAYALASSGGNAQGKAIDAAGGRLAIVGHYVGDVDPGMGPLGATPGLIDHGLLSVFDGPGSLRWAGNLAGADNYLEGAALDDAGALYACGQFRDGAILGEPASGDWDGVLIALDAMGGERWHVAIGTAGLDRVDAVTLAPDGDVVIGGLVSGDFDFGAGPSAGLGGVDGFVARYAPDGALRWARRVGGTGDDLVTAVAVAQSGLIVAAGHFSGTAEMGPETLTARGEADVMVFGVAPDGGAVPWAYRFGGPGLDEGAAVDVDGAEVIVAGRVSDDADFDGVVVHSAGGTDVFVHRFVP